MYEFNKSTGNNKSYKIGNTSILSFHQLLFEKITSPNPVIAC